MIPLSLGEVATATGGRLHAADQADVIVDAVSTDTRAIPAGAAMFVALAGEGADGHAYLDDAVRAGTRAVLVERLDHPAPDERSGLPVPAIVVPDTWEALRALASTVRRRCAPTAVAITGSVGKTTVKDLSAAAIGAERRVHAAQGSYNNELGVPVTLLGLEPHHEVLVAEVGARHEGDIAALAPLVAPDVAVVTAVAAVHLEVFGSVDTIARSKAELVDALGDDGMAVLHAADPRVAAMASRAPASLSVAVDDPRADVHAEDVHLDRWARPSATAVTPWGRAELRLPIAGRHQLTNGLLALAVAGHLGVDVEAAAVAIASAPVSRWRGEVLDLDGVVVLDDAYNANPTAVRASLETLVAVQRTGRTVAVLGEMAEIGPGAPDEHRMIGQRCAELGIDRVIVVGDRAAPIAAGAREAGAPDVVEVVDAASAADAAADGLSAGDVVLVKASRVAGLEVVAEQLRARRTGAHDATGARR